MDFIVNISFCKSAFFSFFELYLQSLNLVFNIVSIIKKVVFNSLSIRCSISL